ncbi:hypothetical protein GpartN1_g4724.t1 [Galdieria partita]|uniref:CBM20 domain-containing protein n=1 Tax=Galdieria partita TaxID=83374 RepID=A0A9C7UR69_9RHOD|nr:hypothetical protein GpartN1_g4116.t1 [Galdieria partita]GJQ12933.1 hypothetical protein GpartN1_g4724.t1 [Galdieria partita]
MSPFPVTQHSRDDLTETVTVVFSCGCPFYIGDNAVLAICGSTQALGNWNLDGAKYLEREPSSEGLWKTKLKLPHTQLEYKYLILSKQDSVLIRWESRWNRNLDLVENKLAAKIVEDTFDR